MVEFAKAEDYKRHVTICVPKGAVYGN